MRRRSSTDDGSWILVLRPRWIQWLLFLNVAGSTVLVILIALVIIGDRSPGARSIVVGIGLVVIIISACRSAFVALFVSAEGVVVSNFLRTKRLSWESIRSIEERRILRSVQWLRPTAIAIEFVWSDGPRVRQIASRATIDIDSRARSDVVVSTANCRRRRWYSEAFPAAAATVPGQCEPVGHGGFSVPDVPVMLVRRVAHPLRTGDALFGQRHPRLGAGRTAEGSNGPGAAGDGRLHRGAAAAERLRGHRDAAGVGGAARHLRARHRARPRHPARRAAAAARAAGRRGLHRERDRGVRLLRVRHPQHARLPEPHDGAATPTSRRRACG